MDYVELDNAPEVSDALFKWSGANSPPEIGQKVRVRFGSMGSGTVIGYFSEGGYLGVRVALDKEPEWRVSQNKAGSPALVFGIEIDY